jgi:hypothetical protein
MIFLKDLNIFTLNPASIATAAVGFILLYTASLVFYRLYWSPLAKFPGPKLAAATQWYETYYELISGGGGNFTRQIKKMHDKYGIVTLPHSLASICTHSAQGKSFV